MLRHALRNALIPVVTLVALDFGALLSGAVLTEQVFTIPGFGKLIVDAVFNRDYAVVQGVVLCTALAYMLLNLCADIALFGAQSEAAAVSVGHAGRRRASHAEDRRRPSAAERCAILSTTAAPR